jgi:hypothetical protein
MLHGRKALASAPDSRTPKSWYKHELSILALVSYASRCTFRPDPVGRSALVEPERDLTDPLEGDPADAEPNAPKKFLRLARKGAPAVIG